VKERATGNEQVQDKELSLDNYFPSPETSITKDKLN